MCLPSVPTLNQGSLSLLWLLIMFYLRRPKSAFLQFGSRVQIGPEGLSDRSFLQALVCPVQSPKGPLSLSLKPECSQVPPCQLSFLPLHSDSCPTTSTSRLPVPLSCDHCRIPHSRFQMLGLALCLLEKDVLLPGTGRLGVENSSCQEVDLRFLPWLFSLLSWVQSPAVPPCLAFPLKTLKAAFIIFTLQMRRMRLQVVRQLPLDPRARKWGCCWCLVAKSCPTLCNLMGCSLPGSSVHGILQARILKWIAFSFSSVSS